MYWTQIREQEHPEMLHLVRTEVKYEGDPAPQVWWTFRRPGVPDFTLPDLAEHAGTVEWAAPMRAQFIDNVDRYWIECIIPPDAPFPRQSIEIQEAGETSIPGLSIQKIERRDAASLDGKLVAVITTTKPLTFKVHGMREHWVAVFDNEEAAQEGLADVETPEGESIALAPIGKAEPFLELARDNGWRIMSNPRKSASGGQEFVEIVSMMVPGMKGPVRA